MSEVRFEWMSLRSRAAVWSATRSRIRNRESGRAVIRRRIPHSRDERDAAHVSLFQVAAETLDAPACFLEILGLSRIGNAKSRSQSECRALHDRHTLGLEEFSDKILVSGEFLSGWCGFAHRAGAGRVDIEGTLRRRTLDAIGLVEHRHHEVAALLEDLVVFGDEILRTVQRLHRGPLRDGRRV